MLRALEQEEKVFSSCSSEGFPSDTKELQHDKLEREWRSFKKEMWNPFVDRVDADSETLNGRSNRHRQLLDDNLKWQRKAEELAGRHEQRIAQLETALEERDIYVNNIECMLAELSGKVSEMEALGTRAQIPTGYMVKTLRSQSTFDSNMPSDQMLSTF